MITFEIERIPEFVTIQKVNKLIRNERCLFDEFVAQARYWFLEE